MVYVVYLPQVRSNLVDNPRTVTPAFAFALTYLVVCNSILAISLLLMMIRQGEVTRVSSLFFLVPPGAAVMALWVLDEPMAPLAWVGMLIAISGVWLVSRSSAEKTAVID